MSIQQDPEEVETHLLTQYLGDLAGRTVLEVGCGDGRVTWRYAERAGRVVAIDPKPAKIALAEQNKPAHLRQRVTFLATDLESYAVQAIKDGERFDRAVLSWSL